MRKVISFGILTDAFRDGNAFLMTIKKTRMLTELTTASLILRTFS